MSRILLTGAAGFIGSNLAERLLADGHEVIGVDNFDAFYDAAVKRDNLAAAVEHANFTLCEADIRDRAAVDAILHAHPVDTFVHLAARAGVRPSIEQPHLYADVNVNGTVALLEAARALEGVRFIFASSSSVYGNNKKVPFHEDDRVDHPISPYAATKKAGELICHTFHHLYAMPITCLRFFTVYGPRCRPDLAIPKFTRIIDSGEPVPMFGDGTMRRDFTHIGDILDGIVRSIERCTDFHVYNLGESRPIELRTMIETIAEALGKPVTIKSLPRQPGDVDVTYADVSRARAELGYNPTTQFADGIRDFIAWYRAAANRT